MNPEKAFNLLTKAENDKAVQNFIAQGNSRNILFDVNEPEDSFPKFTEGLDTRLESIAFSYLSIGCTILEQKDFSNEGIIALEKGAEVLEYIHSSERNPIDKSSYLLLASALAYYSAFQYSKAYILLKKVQYENKASILVSSFLKKDFQTLNTELNSVFLDDEFKLENFPEADQLFSNYIVYTQILAKSISRLLDFIFSGDEEHLVNAKEYLGDLLELTSIDLEPAMWWIARLLRIIVDGIAISSPWTNLPNQWNEDTILTSEYIRSLAFGKPHITELFVSQRKALQKVLTDSSTTIGLPTSSGKTRIAEIAILQNLIDNPDSITLYLAPFRSLAFEVEEALSRTFNPIGYHVSHLYGGAQFNKVDKALIDESRIIVATPEKAKAIIRANDEVSNRIKLLVIDEGHLLGASQRYITNELFVEELKVYIENNNGKIILLSAVLPNTKDISKWISSSEENIIESSWRPSTQRFGTLEWTGDNVNISWKSKESPSPFNRDFIESFPVKRSKYPFPKNKREAIALTAVKLSSIGSVLIFVGRKNMVNGQAKDVAKAISLTGKEQHIWKNQEDLETFELACLESFGKNSDIYKFAIKGIICHDAGLPAEVRLTMEKLMRNGNPQIIISTSTLAQGVNIGVSSVIIANVYIGSTPINKKDFWNIAGRAGRAFVDSEGKILYALDLTKDQITVVKDRKLAEDYFDSSKMENAVSGIFQLIKRIFEIGNYCGIDSELLLDLIAENDFSNFKDEEGNVYSEALENSFDWLDDTLLALNHLFQSQNLEDSSSWIDNFFRKSLAFIQAEKHPSFESENIISFFKARNKAVLKLAGSHENWKSYITSGIPLKSSLIIETHLNEILQVLNIYESSDQRHEDLIAFLKSTEEITKTFPSKHFKNGFSDDVIDLVRPLWISGKPMTEILKVSSEGLDICTEYFGFTLPWAINAISRKLNDLDYPEQSEKYSDLAMLTELGLPNYKATKIYLSGIKSRSAATEIGEKLSFNQDLQLWKLISFILNNIDSLKEKCSELTNRWLDTIRKNKEVLQTVTITKTNITIAIKDIPKEEKLFIRKGSDEQKYICTN